MKRVKIEVKDNSEMWLNSFNNYMGKKYEVGKVYNVSNKLNEKNVFWFNHICAKHTAIKLVEVGDD